MLRSLRCPVSVACLLRFEKSLVLGCNERFMIETSRRFGSVEHIEVLAMDSNGIASAQG